MALADPVKWASQKKVEVAYFLEMLNSPESWAKLYDSVLNSFCVESAIAYEEQGLPAPEFNDLEQFDNFIKQSPVLAAQTVGVEKRSSFGENRVYGEAIYLPGYKNPHDFFHLLINNAV